MTPALFGLAESDENGNPDPDKVWVWVWGMETEERAILYWREEGRNQFGVFKSAETAARRFARGELLIHRP